MGMIHEAFIRCECGSPNFVSKEIVSLSKASFRAKEIIKTPDDSRTEYYCIRCEKKYVLPSK